MNCKTIMMIVKFLSEMAFDGGIKDDYGFLNKLSHVQIRSCKGFAHSITVIKKNKTLW